MFFIDEMKKHVARRIEFETGQAVAETTGGPRWQDFTTLTLKPVGTTPADQRSNNADSENIAFYS